MQKEESTRRSRRSRDIDEKIVHSCNELIQVRTESARLRAQQQTEYRKALQLYQQKQKQWQDSSKAPSNTKKTSSQQHDISIHQAEVLAVFTEDEEKDSLPPFLVTQLSNLCYHVHKMALLETFAQTTVHEEYRTKSIWWIHEYWEELEKETNQINDEKEKAMSELSKIKQQHKSKLAQLQRSYQQKKKDILESYLGLMLGKCNNNDLSVLDEAGKGMSTIAL